MFVLVCPAGSSRYAAWCAADPREDHDRAIGARDPAGKTQGTRAFHDRRSAFRFRSPAEYGRRAARRRGRAPGPEREGNRTTARDSPIRRNRRGLDGSRSARRRRTTRPAESDRRTSSPQPSRTYADGLTHHDDDRNRARRSGLADDGPICSRGHTQPFRRTAAHDPFPVGPHTPAVDPAALGRTADVQPRRLLVSGSKRNRGPWTRSVRHRPQGGTGRRPRSHPHGSDDLARHTQLRTVRSSCGWDAGSAH